MFPTLIVFFLFLNSSGPFDAPQLHYNWKIVTNVFIASFYFCGVVFFHERSCCWRQPEPLHVGPKSNFISHPYTMYDREMSPLPPPEVARILQCIEEYSAWHDGYSISLYKSQSWSSIIIRQISMFSENSLIKILPFYATLCSCVAYTSWT